MPWARAGSVSLFLLASLAAAPVLATEGPPPPTGELVLDMSDPVLEVRIGRVPLRLRVALEQKRLIELNPDAAERLRDNPPDRRFRFEDGFEAQIGREVLHGIQAAAPVTLNDRKMLVSLSSHGRDCCQGVDGEIGIGLLPWATIRFVREGAPPPTRSARFMIDDNEAHGPQTNIAVGRSSLFVQFSLSRPDSVATGAAGAILAREYGGKLAEPGTTVAAFGIERPTAMMTLRRPASVAGFGFDRLPVRAADFAGREKFPTDPDEPADIVVRRKVSQQEAWPVVLIGRDRLDRCSEARFDAIARELTLYCAEEGAR